VNGNALRYGLIGRRLRLDKPFFQGGQLGALGVQVNSHRHSRCECLRFRTAEGEKLALFVPTSACSTHSAHILTFLKRITSRQISTCLIDQAAQYARVARDIANALFTWRGAGGKDDEWQHE